MMTRNELKVQADQLIAKLPDETDWEDLMYSIYVRKKINQGIASADAGRVKTTEEAKRALGLTK